MWRQFRGITIASLVAMAAQSATMAMPAAAQDNTLFSGGTQVGDAALGGVAVGIGQSLLTTNDTESNAKVEDNIIAGSNLLTGDVANNVIQNNRGITTVLSNTGNNVAINNATILNVFLNAGPGNGN